MADPLAGYNALTNPDQETVEKMAKLILDDDLSIVWGLFLCGSPKDMESIASIVLKFFDQHQRELYLMKQAITKEVQLTVQSATLFRQNNFASKLLSCYSKRFGLTYINQVLYDCVLSVCLNHQKDPDWSCEINPTKLGDDKKHLVEKNLENLKELSKAVLDKILASYDAVPLSFRKLCVHLKQEAQTKFPEEYPRTTFASVGGFIFLRFICPATVVPHKYGLLEIQPGQAIIRDLMMLSKVLQTVANGVLFGKKEEYLLPLNGFVEQYQSQVLEFLDKLGEPEQNRRRSASFCKQEGEEQKVLVRKRTQTIDVGRRRSKSVDHLEMPEAVVRVRSRKRAKAEATKPKKEQTEQTEQKEKKVEETAIPLSKSAPSQTSHPNFDDHTFTYGELMGIIQYLTVYWKKMKPHLVQMDNNFGTKHTEAYIQLSILLQKLGVTSQEVTEQLNAISEKRLGSKKKGFGGFFSKKRK